MHATPTPPQSRIAEARRRAAGAKRTAVAAAAAGFIALLLLARASHPGHASSTHSTSASTPATSSEQDGNGFDLSPGTLGQCGGSGSSGAQTGVS
jgi:hypothetical protein